MANPHPEPHPENLRPLKKGDSSAKDIQSKGGRASSEAARRKRTMREWAELMGSLPMKKGKTTDPKAADGIKESNLTLDGAIIAAMYSKAAKGDVRAAEYLAKLKGQTSEDVVVHIDAMAEMDTDQLLALYARTRAKE